MGFKLTDLATSKLARNGGWAFGPVGGLMSNFAADTLTPSDEPSPNDQAENAIPKIDQKVYDSRDRMQAEALRLRAAKPALEDKAGNISNENSRMDLQDKIKSIRQSSNARGMLYGGQRAGAEANAGAATGADIANQRAAINNRMEAQTRGAELQGIQSGVDVNQLEAQRSNDVYNYAQDKEAQRANLLKGIGSVAGGLAGNAAASSGSNNQSSNQPISVSSSPSGYGEGNSNYQGGYNYQKSKSDKLGY